MDINIARRTAQEICYEDGMMCARIYLNDLSRSGDITWEEHRRIMVGLLHLAGVDLSLATI